ncbi:hypothetical protein DOTSEDRAFT_74875 [Dothistroma septosporum NZE10]|uniref:Ecp2 effector protein domain-containing protein n=1 Tax=Dothistroma septosporum (strain NZE10 / CBS 128990) TaxID=675120 RepID=N1PCI4_DOTSN|nr:hypothetical protein DOTSEDRAFT_74875 [Dothistroma septosporum NZE10]
MAPLWRTLLLTLLAAGPLVFARCNVGDQKPARADDVAAAISQLVQRGGNCGPLAYGSAKVLVVVNSAQIVGVNVGTNQQATSASCAGVARAVGLIMDECTTDDIVNGKTVSGRHTVPGNDNFNVIALRIDD